MNEEFFRTIRIALRTAPTAALVSGIVCPPALGDPGDLDPTFADVGRLAPEGSGVVRSLEAEDDDDVFFAGGGLSRSFYETESVGLAGRFAVDGTLDDAFSVSGLRDTLIIDTAIQPDGKVVGIGQQGASFGPRTLLVFRIEADGALDDGFGVNGKHVIADLSGLGSLALDPATGNVVIAGWQGGDLKVLRLLPSGAPDDTFATAGIFTAPADTVDEFIQAAPRVLIAANGGYRVTDNDAVESGVSRCRVLALTADGAIDDTFGDHGYAGLTASSDVITCRSLVEATDGGLLVAGSDGLQPLLVKLVATGASDPVFAADALATASVTDVAAIGVDSGTGSIVIAATHVDNVSGFPVLRLQTDGSPDASFGIDGTTWVDANSTFNGAGSPSTVTVLENSDILVGGGTGPGFFFAGRPLVARLVGVDDARKSPGVLDVKNTYVETVQGDSQAVVTVRRIGGKTGAVSVAYATQAGSDPGNPFEATAGDDFTSLDDRLTWADGEVADKQIIVPLAASSAPEESETFQVVLTEPDGGAGLGAADTTVAIASNAPAAGMFRIEGDPGANEVDGVVSVAISRNYSWTGAVSVTLTPSPDSAHSGDDFDGDPVTVSWVDGDAEPKEAIIPIVNDSNDELDEQFTIALTNPTGGAVIGPTSTVTATIFDDDPVEPPPVVGGGGGGGGELGLGSLLWLGLLRWVRQRRGIR
jgi:uncharacterized delta-60 repeat protein